MTFDAATFDMLKAGIWETLLMPIRFFCLTEGEKLTLFRLMPPSIVNGKKSCLVQPGTGCFCF